MPATNDSPRSRRDVSRNYRRRRHRSTGHCTTRGGAGYDDNVALRSESIDGSASGEDDAFGDCWPSASVAFGHNWHVDAAAAVLDYIDLDEFDQGVLSLGARRGFTLDAWYLELGAYGTQLSLGHDVFERSATAEAPRQRAASVAEACCRAQLRATAVDGEGDFTGLSGARAELGVNYDWSWQAWSFGAYTRAELNDSEDDVFASRWVELGGQAQWSHVTALDVLGGRHAASHATPGPGGVARVLGRSPLDASARCDLEAVAAGPVVRALRT